MTQISLASAAYLSKKKKTRGEQFLEEMDKAIPWDALLRIVERRHRKVDSNGRPKMPTERMLRIYFLQQWFNLSDPGAEEALADGIKWRVSRKASSAHPLSDKDRLTEKDREWNRNQSRIRAFGEHPFQVIKCLWHHTKVRYRGLFKNTCQLFSFFALSNIYQLRHRLATS